MEPEPTRQEIDETLEHLATLIGIDHLKRKEEEIEEIDENVTHIAWKFTIERGGYVWQVAQLDARFKSEDEPNGYSAYVEKHMRTDFLLDIEEIVKQHKARRILPPSEAK